MLMKPSGNTERQLKALVYGAPGTGKTTLGVTAPDPVILLTERHGWASVEDAALRLGRPVPPTVWCDSAEKLGAAIRALRSHDPLVALCEAFADSPEEALEAIAVLPYKRPKTVVLDSVTEAARYVADHVDREAPPKIGKDGLPTRSERAWGVVGERCERMIRAFRDLDYSVLFLALLDDREVGEGDERSRLVQPLMTPRKLASVLSASVNAAGVMVAREQPAMNGQQVQVKRWVQFATPSWTMTKLYRPLRDREVANFSDWVTRIATGERTHEPLDGDPPVMVTGNAASTNESE